MLSLTVYLRKDGFLNLRTNKYKLHFYETPSGLKFVMNTDLSVGNTRDVLHQMYSSVSTYGFLVCAKISDVLVPKVDVE